MGGVSGWEGWVTGRGGKRKRGYSERNGPSSSHGGAESFWPKGGNGPKVAILSLPPMESNDVKALSANWIGFFFVFFFVIALNHFHLARWLPKGVRGLKPSL